MTLTTRIRFTQPIDPRAVWAKARELINAPDNYRWDCIPVRGYESCDWPPNPRWRAPF